MAPTAPQTDRDAHGETVPIPYLPRPRHRQLACRTGPPQVHHRALLRPVDRHGRLGGKPGHLGRGNGTRISGEAINLIVRRAALLAALPNANTAHSLRAGGAIAAARAGAEMTAIAAHGRWAEGSPVGPHLHPRRRQLERQPHARHRPMISLVHGQGLPAHAGSGYWRLLLGGYGAPPYQAGGADAGFSQAGSIGQPVGLLQAGKPEGPRRG